MKKTVSLNKNAILNTKWEIINGAIRNVSIKVCSYKKKTSKQRENDIIQSIKTLEDKINKDDNNNKQITKELFVSGTAKTGLLEVNDVASKNEFKVDVIFCICN